MAITHSIMNVVFHDEGIHLTSHSTQCNSSYCSLYGKCSVVRGHWKKCDCNDNFYGPTCAFNGQGERDQVYGLIHNITKVVERVDVNEENLPKLLTIVRLIAGSRHYFSHEIVEFSQNFVDRIIVKFEKMDVTVEDLTEVFKIVESVQASLTHHHFTRDSGYSLIETDKFILKNHQLIEKMFKLYAEYFAEVDTGDDAFAFTLREKNLTISNGIPFDRIVATLEDPNEAMETVLIFFPKAEFNDPASIVYKPILRYYEYLTRYNQFEILMDDVYDVVAPVAQMSSFIVLQDKNISTRNPLLNIAENRSIHIMFPRKVEDLDEICAWWNDEFNYWDTDGCKSTPGKQLGMEEHYFDNEQIMQCECRKGSIWTVVKPNPNALTMLSDRQVHAKPDIAVVIVIMISVMIVIQCIVMKKEGNPNSNVQDEYTIHPVYSIIFVTNGTLERKMRVQLLFLSFAMQLLTEMYFLEKNYSITSLAIHGIIVSVPCNYLFGVLANIMTSLEKIKGKTVFMILTTAGMTVVLAAADIFWVRPETRPEVVTTVISAFLLGMAIDLGVLDILATYLCQLSPQLRNLMRFRGFEHETPIPGTTKERKRFIMENL